MEYIYNDALINIVNLQDAEKNQNNRLLMYYKKLQELRYEKKEYDERCEKKQFINIFWAKESKLEQRIYGKLKEWERRHPIMGIVLCTVLGGILMSLIAGIILEAIKML